MMNLALYLVVCSTVFLSATQSDVDVEKLFHSNRPPTPQGPPIELLLNNDFQPYRGARHDEFDWTLIKNMLSWSNYDENKILSPFLVKTMISLLGEAAGVDTSTRRELLSVLPSIATDRGSREMFEKIFGSLTDESADNKVYFGSKLYVDEFIRPQQRFAAIIKSFYKTDVESIEFVRSREAARKINSWCAGATNNHITEIVKPADVARSIIMVISTLHFDDIWDRPFNSSSTFIGNFHVDSRLTATVSFITKLDEYYYYESTELDAKILRLPYKGYKFAMYIFLPNQRDGFSGLISRIDSNSLSRSQILMVKVNVRVSLPRFRISHTVHLNDVLKKLGIRQMFTTQASFPRLQSGVDAQDSLIVTDILQKTSMEINEEGSTTSTARPAHNIILDVVEFNADRPFLFLIEDETTGTLVLAGKFVNPQ